MERKSGERERERDLMGEVGVVEGALTAKMSAEAATERRERGEERKVRL